MGTPSSSRKPPRSGHRRIHAFARKHGHDHIWSYLRASPGRSLDDIANEIGGTVTSDQLTDVVTEHCLENGQMSELLRDHLLRSIREGLPKGWGAAKPSDRADALGVFGFIEPYRTLLWQIRRVLIEDSPPPRRWSPVSPDDPVLVAAYAQGLAAMKPRERKTVALGKLAPRPGETYWLAIEPYFKAVDIYRGPAVFKRHFATVPPPMGYLLAAHWCQSEVRNGGFSQFFDNWTGVLAPEAAAGFIAIGMPRCGALVTEAMQKLGAVYPRDRAKRYRVLDKLPDDTSFDAIDDAFYERIDREARGFEAAADAWARKHSSTSADATRLRTKKPR